MMTAIVLAAGKASRLGEPKGLVAVRGEPWLAWQLRRLAEAGVLDVVVVVGFSAHAYHAREEELRRAFPLGALRFVVNPNPELGPFSSLQVGLREGGGGPAFVLPVDAPVAEPCVWKLMGETLKRGAWAVAPRWEPRLGRARGGHPVGLSADAIARILALDPSDEGARLDRFLAGGTVETLRVEEPRVAMNFNTRLEWLSQAPLVVDAGPLQVRLRERSTLVCVRDGGILALRARDPASGIEYAFPPGGGIEPGETPEEAALRELREETGFHADCVSGSRVEGSYFFAWGGSLYYLHTHFFQGSLRGDPEPPFHPDDAALLERVWIPLARAPEFFGGFPVIHEGIMAVLS